MIKVSPSWKLLWPRFRFASGVLNFSAVLGLVSFLGILPLRAEMKSGDLIAICGDSITEQRLYSALMEEYLLACQPQKDLSAFQAGWGGERAGGLASRLGNDVLPFKPTVATTCYGMNDGNYAPVSDGTLKAYRDAMTNVVKQLKEGGVRFIVVGSPGVVDPASYKRPNSSAEEYNKTLKALGDTAKEVAQAEGVQYADVFTPMMESMTKAKAQLGADYRIAGDGVHPTPNGHLAMAYAFLKALGCDGEIGTLTLDYTTNKAESDSGQKVLSSDKGTLEIESTRYPFCFLGEAGDTGTKAMTAFLPFNEELNRYVLKVKNAPAKAKVTWGEESHDYTAEQLAAGVNLAADFTNHPFKDPFAKVVAAVNEQQNFEQEGIKGLLHSLISWKKFFPGESASQEALVGLILKKDSELRAASRAAVVPVKHSIKIEPAS